MAMDFDQAVLHRDVVWRLAFGTAPMPSVMVSRVTRHIFVFQHYLECSYEMFLFMFHTHYCSWPMTSCE